MKPSERRALKELKVQKEKETADFINSLPEETEVKADKSKKCGRRKKSIHDEDVISMRKEGFFQSRVKTITFIVCITLFLVFGITITVIPSIRRANNVKGEVQMELDDIVAIAAKKEFISWADFDNYIYTDYSTRTTKQQLYVVKTEDRRYAVMVTGPKGNYKYPDQVIFYDIEIGNTTYIDLSVDDINSFLAGYSSTPTKYISFTEMQGIAYDSAAIKWSDFADYKFEETLEYIPSKDVLQRIRVYRLNDANLSIWVYGEKLTEHPFKVLLVDDSDRPSNLNEGTFINLMTATPKEIEAFINNYEN